MNCPYCDKTMLHGKLLGDQHQLRWLPDNKKMPIRSVGGRRAAPWHQAAMQKRKRVHISAITAAR